MAGTVRCVGMCEGVMQVGWGMGGGDRQVGKRLGNSITGVEPTFL